VDFDPVRAKDARAAGSIPAGQRTGQPIRLPTTSKRNRRPLPDSFEGSELGEIPEGWESVVNLVIVAMVKVVMHTKVKILLMKVYPLVRIKKHHS
jgi:hypothetical protein